MTARSPPASARYATRCWRPTRRNGATTPTCCSLSRNIHRDGAQAFAADPLAQNLTLHAIAIGWDTAMPPDRRVFLYMPLMHAEDAPLQAISVEKYAALGIAENLKFAQAHRDAITRFGRFPGRNAALGRRSTAEEDRWLEENHGGW